MIPKALEFLKINKSFFGVKVLKEVSFFVPEGCVVGLVGENGAGKSTLMNILCGNLSADSGEIRVGSLPFRANGPADSRKKGVTLVHQELNLFPNLSIAENLSIADFPLKGPAAFSWINREKTAKSAAELLEQVELGEDPDTLVETLGPGKRQLVEIAKALKGNPRIIAFDEPTTSLTEKESVSLFRIIRRLRDKGTAVIYISHNLGDILRICDRVVVLRDGEVAADQPSAEFDISRMIQLMIGRSLEAQFPRRTPPASKEPVLAAKELSYPGVIESVSFQLHRGELLGISGLMGSGRTELARILFGLDPVQSGELLIEGVPVHSLSPKKSIDRGMAFLTEDRKEEGLLTEASIEENLTLASLEKFAGSLSGILDSAHLHREAADLSKRMSIDSRNVRTQLVKTLSGGNQQKVVFGKWFMKGAKILILDEPTRGVDVGARFEIYQMIIDRLEQGAAVILISSDLEELLGLCDRILVMSKGEIHADIPREQFNRQEILRRALGKERLQ